MEVPLFAEQAGFVWPYSCFKFYMITRQEMYELIAEGQQLYDKLMDEAKRLNLLTFGDEPSEAVRAMQDMALEDVDLPMNDPELTRLFREEANRVYKHYERRAKTEMRHNLSSVENEPSSSGNNAFQSPFFNNNEACIPENREDEKHYKDFDAEKFIKKYFKENALRPVNIVEPGRLPFRHDQLLKMEQYRKGWKAKPPPGERSWREERWRIRRKMAEQDVPVVRVTRMSPVKDNKTAVNATNNK